LPLTSGYIYIGQANQDPETDPIAVYQDAGLTIPLVQPIRTVGGYIAGTGTPANIYPSATPYSIRVRSAAGIEIFYEAAVHDEIADLIAQLYAALAAVTGPGLIGFSQTATYAAGTIGEHMQKVVFVTDAPYSAKGDGATDDYAAINSALASGKSCVFPSGAYKIGTNLTITDATLLKGAVLKPASGVTITLAGTFNAPLAKVFDTSLGGTIVVSTNAAIVGRPEWWGAIINDSSSGAMTTNLAAIGAAVVASPIVEFTSADYFLNATLKINTPHRTLRGVSRHWSSAGQSTRIVQMSATADAIQIGPDTMPGGGPNSFLQEVHLKNMSIVRGPTLTGNATWKTCPAGIRFQYCLYCSAESIWTTEHSIGVIFSGAVQTRVKEVFAFRSLVGTDPAHDPFFGFLYDGSPSFGLASGNASVYESDCNTTVGGSPALTISAHSYGQLGYTDWFIERPESAGTQYGMVLDGTGASATGTQDIHVSNAVFDQCLISGMKIFASGAQTLVNIVNPYVALNTGSTTGVAAIDIENNAGLVDLDGGQILGGLATTGDVGIKVNSSSGVNIRGILIRESRAPVQVSGSSNCTISPRINNPTVGTSGAGAIALSGSNSRITGAPQIIGGAGVFGPGINTAGTTTTNSTFDVSGIDPTSCTASAKLSYNGTAVTTAGTFGTTNLAQGNFN
jgi:hypothetical protein